MSLIVDISWLDDCQYHGQCWWHQLLNAIGIEGGIHDREVLKYEPSVTFRLIFHYLMSIYVIKWWNITLDVSDGWYFRTWQSWMPCSMPVALSSWVGLLKQVFLILLSVFQHSAVSFISTIRRKSSVYTNTEENRKLMNFGTLIKVTFFR